MVSVTSLLAAAAVAIPAQADVGGAAIVSYVNSTRASNGIPAGIVHDPVLSDGCAKHNAYGALNGVLEHAESMSKPGFTAAGNAAAGTSVLYQGGPWTAASNPFQDAPIHLHQLLAPRLDRMGASENQGYGCATTLASRNRPAPPADVTYTYPGNGTGGWPTAQVAAEGPYTPGQQVGIPEGTTTGPYLYAMFDGPDMTPFDLATPIGATLTGPQGAVGVAVAGNTTPGLEYYLPTGMQVIPRAPLLPNTTYTASVAASVTTGSGPRLFSRTWSFSTRASSPEFRVVSFVTSPKRLRVSKSGRFTYRFLATPGLAGKARFTSTKRVRIGAKKRKMKLGSKRFTGPANGRAKVKLKLSRKNLRALRKRPSLLFAVVVTAGGATYKTTLTLRRPKKR